MGRLALFWMGVAAVAMTTVGCGGSEPGAGGGGSGGDADGTTSPTTTGGEPTCLSVATRSCAGMELCLAGIFGYLYTGIEDCKAQNASSCTEAKLGGATGLVDPDGCEAASVVSCEDYLDSAEVCAWKPGTKTVGESCKDDRQCGAGLYCDDWPCGHCVAAVGMGEFCNRDPASGLQCDYRRPDVTCAGTLDDPWDLRCRTMSFGAVGASCAPETELGCATGLVCADGSCVAALPRGAACDSSMDKCDRLLSCIDEDGAEVCGDSIRLAELGEVCEDSVAVTMCRAGTYCDFNQSPWRCAPTAAKGAACEQLAACARGLECKDGTCQDAEPITCE